MLALLDGRPRVLTLKENSLWPIWSTRREIITRRSQFMLESQGQSAYFEGPGIALDNLDRIIALIRGSADVEQAREGLMREFGLSEKQARPSLIHAAAKINGSGKAKLQEEYRSLMEEIAFLEPFWLMNAW